MKYGSLTLVLVLALGSKVKGEKQFLVEKVTPKAGAEKVELEPLIQIHTNGKFDPKTVNGMAVRLRDAKGKDIPCKISADLGGVITLSVEKPLRPQAEYQIEVTAKLKAADGRSLKPFTSSFRTGNAVSSTRGSMAFRFTRHRIDKRNGICGLALAPGHRLYSCTWNGTLLEYRLDGNGHAIGKPRTVLSNRKRRFLAMVADPKSTEDQVILWLSHDSLSQKSLGANDFSGTISRITIREKQVEQSDVITGLPTGDHPATGLVFGPKGDLFVSQGALTMLGEKPGLKETPLSAATLRVDLQDPRMAHRKEPLSVRTEAPVEYDPQKGPVYIYATGIREAYDLCWHTNGQLYAGVNMNDTKEKTPFRPGLPTVNVRPDEMLIRILPGKYYGHPNPSRNEWVLLGGNPTKARDPWEVPMLPVGTKPEPQFDPKLLIRNLKKDKGPSANGSVEWTGSGPLQGRLLLCFYTATRGIHAYAFSKDGSRVVDHQPLLDQNGGSLRFGAPLDIVFDKREWLYVADFSAPQRGDSGKDGGIWLARPVRKP